MLTRLPRHDFNNQWAPHLTMQEFSAPFENQTMKAFGAYARKLFDDEGADDEAADDDMPTNKKRSRPRREQVEFPLDEEGFPMIAAWGDDPPNRLKAEGMIRDFMKWHFREWRSMAVLGVETRS